MRTEDATWKKVKQKRYMTCGKEDSTAQSQAERQMTSAREIMLILESRPDIVPEILNRVILKLDKEDRADLRGLHAMAQEHYLAKKEAIDYLETECYTALNSIDLRSNNALPNSVLNEFREVLSKDPKGRRRVISRPPEPRGRFENDPLNPLTRKSNRDQGIKWVHKAVFAPFVVKTPAEVKAAGEKVLGGRTLHLSDGVEFDGAAFDVRPPLGLTLARTSSHSSPSRVADQRDRGRRAGPGRARRQPASDPGGHALRGGAGGGGGAAAHRGA